MHIFISVLIAILTYLSIHFTYTDGWIYDGTWSILKQIKEKLWPTDPRDRGPGWWKAPLAYVFAVIAILLNCLLSICGNISK